MTRARAVVIASLLAFSSAVGQAFADNTYGDCSTFYDRCYEHGMQWPHADAQQVSGRQNKNAKPEISQLALAVMATAFLFPRAGAAPTHVWGGDGTCGIVELFGLRRNKTKRAKC
jgi:hypothetical protein